MHKCPAELAKRNSSRYASRRVGGAVVIPRGLLNRLMGREDTLATDTVTRRQVELTAMKAVMDIELSSGIFP